MKNNKKIAVLLATYNGGKYLSQLLDSLFNQSFQDFDIFVSDDTSEDNTLLILNNYISLYENRIHLLNSKVHFGNACENFFYLISNVESELYMFCDQDDIWLDNKIQYCYEKYITISNKELPIVIHSDLEIVDQDLKTINKSLYKYMHLKKYFTNNEYLIQNNIVGCTMLLNNIALDLYRKNNIVISNVLMHDYFFALIAFYMGKIEYIDIPLIRYRQHSNNSVGARKEKFLLLKRIKTIKRKNNHMIQCIKTNIEFLKILPENNKYRKIIVTYCNFMDMSKFEKITFLIKNKVFEKSISRTIYLLITC